MDDIELPGWIMYAPFVFTIFGAMMISIGLIGYRKNKKRISDNYNGQI
ncbi:MAG: LPXTG cell wall anchor domain-containing protein [Candidatus Nitrosocosmicus sp.]